MQNYGMTLIELLVAFGIFILLIGLLVGFMTTGLDFWSSGEKRKGIYDKAQVILDQMSEDLRSTYIENDLKYSQMPALFICDYDQNKVSRLRFIRNGDPVKVGIIPSNRLFIPAHVYSDLYEVAYILTSDPQRKGKSILWRGIRYFDRSRENTFFNDEFIRNTGNSFFKSNFSQLDFGILYIEYKFWTQYTNTWDTKYKAKKPDKGPDEPIGPELMWDSSRRLLRNFLFHSRFPDNNEPDFVYPEIIQVTIVVEPRTLEYTGTKLLSDLKEEEKMKLILEKVEDLPEAPNFVKVDDEWIEYSEKSGRTLTISKRGARNTKREAHTAGALVHFGETFILNIYIPSYRNATYGP